MPNSLVHYVAGVGSAHAVGLRGRDRALVGLFAVAPDLDVVTAILWWGASAILPIPGDLSITGMWVFGHRGLSHTVLAAVLCGALVWRWRRDLHWALGAGLAWLSQPFLDALSPWPAWPLWPFSEAPAHLPLVDGMDPFLTLVCALASAALLGPLVLGRLPRPGPERRRRWRVTALRFQGPALAAALIAFPLAAAPVPLTASMEDVPLASVHPAGFPGTLVVTEQRGNLTLTEHPFPGATTSTQVLPVVQGRQDGRDDALMAQAGCTLAHLGRYASVTTPVWRLTHQNDTTRLTVIDAVRNATGGGGPAYTFVYEGFSLTTIELGRGDGSGDGWLTVGLPQRVVEAAACP